MCLNLVTSICFLTLDEQFIDIRDCHRAALPHKLSWACPALTAEQGILWQSLIYINEERISLLIVCKTGDSLTCGLYKRHVFRNISTSDRLWKVPSLVRQHRTLCIHSWRLFEFYTMKCADYADKWTSRFTSTKNCRVAMWKLISIRKNRYVL